MLEAKRTLVITAHPDDLELWCGATVAYFVEQGAFVQPVIVAQEREGQFFESGEPVGIVRRKEAERSAAILGIKKPIFLSENIGELDIPDLLSILWMYIKNIRPEQILTHYPLDEHPDHALIGMAVYSLFIQSQEEIPVYFFITSGAYSYSDVEVVNGNGKTKRKALLMHVSQGFNEEGTKFVDGAELYVMAHTPWSPQ
jgi:LmbE family N-acetylglucosaminyl deacetylase